MYCIPFNLLQLYACCLGINAGEVTRTQSGGECDSFRALAAVLPGCLATVIKSHRTWILMLRFHPPASELQMAAPRAAI